MVVVSGGNSRRHGRRVRTLLVATTALVSGVAVVHRTSAAYADSASPSPVTSALVRVAPCRLLDTRSAPAGLSVGTPRSVAIAGRCDVPATATSVAVTVTAVDATAAGWVAVWPTAMSWPGTSSVNVAAGETRANGSIVPLGPDGGLQVMASAPAGVVIDVTAAFVPATTARAGRFVATPPTRLLDTRLTGTARNSQRLTPFSRRGLVVLEAGEDAILVVHKCPGLRGEAALWRRREPWWAINDSQQ